MESGQSLTRVISEMQSEIRKLERENKELRGQLGRPNSALDPVRSMTPQDGGPESLLHGNLRRNASAPNFEGQYKENLIMTVRRYSISSNSIIGARKTEILHKPRRYEETVNSNKWVKFHDGRPSSVYGKPELEKSTNRHSFQEFVNKNRVKVKTVTFLLPVDDIYTTRPVGEQLPEGSSCELQAISETDS